MAELFPIQIIVSLRSLGFCLLLFLACIPNYRFSKSKVILVIGIFVMITFLVVSISIMGIALPWSGSTILIDAIREVFLIWFLMIEIRNYPNNEEIISKPQLLGIY